MQIIFDKELIPSLKERYIVLELDTVFHKGMSEPITLYCIVEYPALEDFQDLNEIIETHARAVKYYKLGDWEKAITETEFLLGHWNKSLDDFYDHLIKFSKESIKNKTTWDGIRITNPE